MVDPWIIARRIDKSITILQKILKEQLFFTMLFSWMKGWKGAGGEGDGLKLPTPLDDVAFSQLD